MSRPEDQLCNGDIEAAGAVAISIPPASRGHQGDGDPFHRRNTNSKLEALSFISVEKSISSVTEAESNSANNSLSAEIPRGHSVLPITTSTNAGSTASGAGPSKRQGLSAPHNAKVIKPPEPKLIHPLLRKIPLHIRFGLNGLLTNGLFMVIYNSALVMFEDRIKVTTIYAVVYFVFIPLGHIFVSLLVFGWPEKYIASLMSNFPIGLTALAIGGVLTGYLDEIQFSDMVDEFIRDHFTFHQMPPRVTADRAMKNEFWSSILVLVVTSLWTYILSIYVNSSPTKSDKKEL